LSSAESPAAESPVSVPPTSVPPMSVPPPATLPSVAALAVGRSPIAPVDPLAPIAVLLPLNFTATALYTYLVPPHLPDVSRGQLVRVPFGKRYIIGVVWRLGDQPPANTPLKEIQEILPLSLPGHLCDFLDRTAAYTLGPLGDLFRMCLGGLSEKALGEPCPSSTSLSTSDPYSGDIPLLSPAQTQAVSELSGITGAGFGVGVLKGPTGSGKTEVYFQAIADTLAQGRQVLILLPEIALTAQMIHRVHKRFGLSPWVWHADVSPRSRRQTWHAIHAGRAKIVVGARSALFLPYHTLGLIVVDEEHDGSYKQEEGAVRYHARDMAVLRASVEKIPILLVSATPSFETLWNVKEGRYHQVTLQSRFQSRLPEIVLVALNKPSVSPPFLSPTVREKLAQTLAQGDQSLVFLNRRGYAPFVACQECHKTVVCSDCGVGMVFHQRLSGLLCHYCGQTQPLHAPCRFCDAQDTLILRGPGVEKLGEEVASFLPQARLAIMSSDHMTSPRKLTQTIDALERREIDLLIGTQMVAKGHHFPHLTCVVIVDADSSFQTLDFRGPERMMQILTQVSGRAGRGEQPGTVYVQTNDPHTPLLHTLVSGTQEDWTTQELGRRISSGWPPGGRLGALIVMSSFLDKGQIYASTLARHAPQDPDIRVFGPIPAPLFKLRQQYRWRFLIRGPKTRPLQPFLKHWIASCPPPSPVRLISDIDPYQFL